MANILACILTAVATVGIGSIFGFGFCVGGLWRSRHVDQRLGDARQGCDIAASFLPLARFLSGRGCAAGGCEPAPLRGCATTWCARLHLRWVWAVNGSRWGEAASVDCRVRKLGVALVARKAYNAQAITSLYGAPRHTQLPRRTSKRVEALCVDACCVKVASTGHAWYLHKHPQCEQQRVISDGQLGRAQACTCHTMNSKFASPHTGQMHPGTSPW